MRNSLLLLLVVISILLSGCNDSETTTNFNISKEVSSIIISGEGIESYFSEATDINRDKKIILDELDEVEIFINALEKAELLSSGGITAEGPGLELTLIYKDTMQYSFPFWLRPGEKTGRFEDKDGRVFIFKKQDISKIETLLRKNAENQ